MKRRQIYYIKNNINNIILSILDRNNEIKEGQFLFFIKDNNNNNSNGIKLRIFIVFVKNIYNNNNDINGIKI